MLAIAKIAKNRKYYKCENCDYKTCNKYDYAKHLITKKHILNDLAMFSMDISSKSQKKSFTCKDCIKEYKDYSGLWRHKKKGCCNGNKTNEQGIIENEIITNANSDIKILTNMVMDVVKQNQELTNKIIDICKNNNSTSISNSSINCHNKTFNLQLFLNETCKDAMNIMDFVESINLQLSDLENVGKLGYVEGISNIIVKNLNDLDVTERPIHCTDKKRETLYIKDENKWEKEDEEKKKIKTVIKKVANKNIRMIQKFKEAHPDCGKSSSKYSDQYDKIIVEAMGGSGNNDLEKEEKIIQKISKNVTIDKDFAI